MSRSKRGKSNNDEFTNEQQSQLEAALQKESQLIDINASRRNEEQFIKFWNQIAKAVNGKGAAQCLNRYQKIRNSLKQSKSPNKTTGPVVPSQILKKSSNDNSKKIKSTKSTKTIKTTITKTTKAQPKAKVQTNKPVTTKSAVKVISSKSIAKPEPETKVPTPRKVASTPSAPVPVQSISTASTSTASKPTPAALPFPTKPPSPWNQLEHHQLESAIKETRTMQDKRERWKLIGTKVSTRSARECLAKFKEMREALLANK